MLDKITEILNATNDKKNLDKLHSNSSTGYSGKKILYVLQEFLRIFKDDNSSCYLEIGVFKGLTLLSVAHANPEINCYGIDDFSFFNKDGNNYKTVSDQIERLGLKNVYIINKDYEDALENLNSYIDSGKIGVYFIDGPHDYRSQLMCLYLVKPYLHENAIIIIDDSNYPHVRQANRDFLNLEREFKLIFEAYTHCHPLNMNANLEQTVRAGWWNGINVIVRDPQNRIEPMFPPTERNRLLFLNEHIVHSMALAEFSSLGIELLQKLSQLKLLSTLKLLSKNFIKIKKSKKKYLYKNANTNSELLPNFNINKSIN